MSTNISLVKSFGAEFLNFVAVVASCMLHLILICLMASMLFVVCCQVFSLKRIYLHRDIYRLTWFYTYATCKRINDILLMLRLFLFFAFKLSVVCGSLCNNCNNIANCIYRLGVAIFSFFPVVHSVLSLVMFPWEGVGFFVQKYRGVTRQ